MASNGCSRLSLPLNFVYALKSRNLTIIEYRKNFPFYGNSIIYHVSRWRTKHYTDKHEFKIKFQLSASWSTRKFIALDPDP